MAGGNFTRGFAARKFPRGFARDARSRIPPPTQAIPHKKVLTRPGDKPWMTGQMCLAIRKSDPDRLLEIYSRCKSPVSWHRYHAHRNLVISFVRKAKTNFNIKN